MPQPLADCRPPSQSMLKTLSAMLDNFDTQMADYMADIDMQVQAFPSDPWLHDEVKMEEDAPGLKLENLAHVKGDGHDQGDLTIEIDMEEHNSAEYDMEDDDQLHQPPENLDVEVYDASLAHSPAMGIFDSVLPTESSFSTLTVPPTEAQEPGVLEPTLPADSAPVTPAMAPVPEEIVAPVSDSHQEAPHDDTLLSAHESITYDVAESFEKASPEETPPVLEHSSSTDAGSVEPVQERPPEEGSDHPALSDLQSQSVGDLHSTFVAPDEPPGKAESIEPLHSSGPQAESTSSGDPHEISEGVYIDPPPAVLLTISSDDHEYELSLFNEPAEWQLPSTEHHTDTHRTLLHHLPTMYYESLYSLFEALRQDEFIQSTFHLPEVELVLQAVDLALTISEDNVYSRDVSLHDLNMLHDGSAIGGPLRTKLYASSPRFIVQYQQVQEYVSRLSHQSRGASFGAHTETHESHTSDHQEAPIGGEPEIHSTKPQANGEKSEESEEPTETETHLPQQNSQPEQVTDPHEEAEHEDDGEVSGVAEKSKDRDPRSDEEESDSYPAVEGNDHDSQSAHTEEGTAVIGLDVLEAEVADSQRDEDEYDVKPSASVYDGSEEGDEIGPENEREIYRFHDIGEAQIADEKEEVGQEPEEEVDEQGDENFHEHSVYAEPEAESEPLPDQFQALPQDTNDEHDQSEGDTNNIDPTTLSDEADGQEYNEDEPLPELPTDPISFDDENWQQELEVFENADETLNDGDENEHSLSNHSSVTLSSRGSKRTYDEYESGGEGYDEEEQEELVLPASPDPKRTRTR